MTGNQRDLAWGRKVFNDAMAQVADDGSLPRELGRGVRALHYHLFAAAPLTMLESILDENSPKMERLTAFCIKGLQHSDNIGKRAGAAQTGVLADDVDWLAVYSRRRPSKETAPLLSARKPDVSRLGGDLSTANPLEHTMVKSRSLRTAAAKLAVLEASIRSVPPAADKGW